MAKRPRLRSDLVVEDDAKATDEKNEEIKELKNLIERQAKDLEEKNKIIEEKDELINKQKKEVDDLKLKRGGKNGDVEDSNKETNDKKKGTEFNLDKMVIRALNGEIEGLKKQRKEDLVMICSRNGEISSLKKQCRKHCKEITELRKDLDEKEVSESELQVKVGRQKKEMEKLAKKIEAHDGFVSKLKNCIECPVCLGVPSDAPVYCCPNGHLICKSCKMDSCPICKEVMGPNKSLLAVTIMENIDHECRIDGCEETISYEELGNHMRDCEHRMVRCPCAGCGETMPLMELMRHLHDSKKCCLFIRDCEVNESGDGSSHISAVNDFFKTKNWKIGIFKYKGVPLALKMDRTDGYFNASFVMFKSEAVCSKYRLEIAVHGADSTPPNADVLSLFIGAPGSVDQDEDRLKHRMLSVSDEAMRTILTKNIINRDQFKVTFKIIQK